MVEVDSKITKEDAQFIKDWVSANSEKFFNESIKLNILKRVINEECDTEKMDTILKKVEDRFEKMKKDCK